jgi:hypothetical protein
MLGSMRKGLSQTLETVLSQAMARDVMHGSYVPRKSPCFLSEVTPPPSGRGEGRARGAVGLHEPTQRELCFVLTELPALGGFRPPVLATMPLSFIDSPCARPPRLQRCLSLLVERRPDATPIPTPQHVTGPVKMRSSPPLSITHAHSLTRLRNWSPGQQLALTRTLAPFPPAGV